MRSPFLRPLFLKKKNLKTLSGNPKPVPKPNSNNNNNNKPPPFNTNTLKITYKFIEYNFNNLLKIYPKIKRPYFKNNLFYK